MIRCHSMALPPVNNRAHAKYDYTPHWWANQDTTHTHTHTCAARVKETQKRCDDTHYHDYNLKIVRNEWMNTPNISHMDALNINVNLFAMPLSPALSLPLPLCVCLSFFPLCHSSASVCVYMWVLVCLCLFLYLNVVFYSVFSESLRSVSVDSLEIGVQCAL